MITRSIEGAPIAQSASSSGSTRRLLRSTGRIDLFDLQGRWVGTRQMAPDQLWIPTGSGIRLLRATTPDGRQEMLLWN